ncbi:cysteine desulfurase family protein [Stomatobaculum longum]|uniref:cysteine desulfurase family protein n=1 Tax=Stomatobaculum longum TaxID=796942 RepID=UPI0028E5816E|nr:cysteine desulfurase family protein [Stomatobaculum longum]
MIYLDHAATAALRPSALEAMLPYLTEQCGNPSALYESGRRARQAVSRARREIAETLGCLPEELYFTSGGTEADNWALLSMAEAARSRGEAPFLVSTAIEHHAVLETLRYGKETGLLDYALLPVSGDGVAALSGLDALLAKRPALVSCMGANNETGALQPLGELLARCRERNVPLHSDLVQVYGQLPLKSLLGEELPDLFSVSAHKFGGPKGVGFLYIRSGLSVGALLHGGSQERGRRAGTENVAGIVGMAAAAKVAFAEMTESAEKKRARTELFFRLLREELPAVYRNGSESARLPGHLNLCFPGVSAELLLILLDQAGIAASAGAACASGALEPSHVLLAMGRSEQEARASLRFSFGAENTEEEVRKAAQIVTNCVKGLQEEQNV